MGELLLIIFKKIKIKKQKNCGWRDGGREGGREVAGGNGKEMFGKSGFVILSKRGEREKCLDGREWVYDEGEFTDVGFVLDCFGGIVLHKGNRIVGGG